MQMCNVHFQMDVNHVFLKEITESHSHLVLDIKSSPFIKEEKAEVLKCIIQSNLCGGRQLTKDGYNFYVAREYDNLEMHT